MRFVATELPGVVIIEPDVYRDSRGYFLETFHADKYIAAGLPAAFPQDNISLSVQRTLRGLHLQRLKPQGKLVHVLDGEIWDVAVDVRPGSAHYGHWVAETLSSSNFRQMYVPPGFAHGFCVMSETARVQYKCTEVYDPADEVGIAYDDPDLGIPWPVDRPILSNRDQNHPRLVELWNGVSPSSVPSR